MQLYGRTRTLALALLVLLMGAPGLLCAVCPECTEAKDVQKPSCHSESGGTLPATTCDENGLEPLRRCCGRIAEEPGPPSQGALAPASPLFTPASAAVAVVPDREDRASPERPREARHSAAGPSLYLLLSVFLI